jgi:Predicted transcriptional regulator containing the HTH domain
VEYIQQSRAFQLVEKAEGWQLATDPGFAKWVRQLFPAPKPARLSAPALETLAIIAYRQPITRADVEAVRGVNIDGVLQTLMERGLVKIAGRAEIPGRPLLYETTQFFPRSLRASQSRRIAKRGRVAETLFAGGATCSPDIRMKPAAQDHRPRLQRICSRRPVGDATCV